MSLWWGSLNEGAEGQENWALEITQGFSGQGKSPGNSLLSVMGSKAVLDCWQHDFCIALPAFLPLGNPLLCGPKVGHVT